MGQFESCGTGNHTLTTHILHYFDASGDGKRIKFYSWYRNKPASGRAVQRKDGIWEHSYERNMSDPYFMVRFPQMPILQASMNPSKALHCMSLDKACVIAWTHTYLAQYELEIMVAVSSSNSSRSPSSR